MADTNIMSEKLIEEFTQNYMEKVFYLNYILIFSKHYWSSIDNPTRTR